jgi:hypothetical protein
MASASLSPRPVAPRCRGCQTATLARTTLPLPFPREVVRDLLGITRALYRAEKAKPNLDAARLEQLLEIGKQFRLALDLSNYDADTMGGRAARSWAEKATATLGEFVADSELMAPAVAATAERLSRRRR